MPVSIAALTGRRPRPSAPLPVVISPPPSSLTADSSTTATTSTLTTTATAAAAAATIAAATATSATSPTFSGMSSSSSSSPLQPPPPSSSSTATSIPHYPYHHHHPPPPSPSPPQQHQQPINMNVTPTRLSYLGCVAPTFSAKAHVMTWRRHSRTVQVRANTLIILRSCASSMSASSISISNSSSHAMTTANALTPRNVERVVELSCWHHPYAVGRHVVRLDFDHDEKLEMVKLQNKHGPAAVAAVAAASGGVDTPHAFALDSSHHYHQGLNSIHQYQHQQQQQQYYPPPSSSGHNHVDQSLVLYFHQPRCATAFRAALLCVTQRPKPTTYSLIATLPSRPSAAAVAEAEYAHQQRLASAAAGHHVPFKHLHGDEDMSASASCKELIHIARKTKVKSHRDVLFSYLNNPHDTAATTATGAPHLDSYEKKDYQQQHQQQVNNTNNISPSTTATTTATATPTASGSSSGDDLSVVDNRPKEDQQQQQTTATLKKKISITHHKSPNNGLDNFSAMSYHSSSPASPLYLVRTIAKSDLKLAPPGPRRRRSHHPLRNKDDRLHAHSIDRYSRGRTRTRAAFSSKYSDALSRSRSRSRSRTRTSHLNHDRRSGIDHGDQLSSSSSSAAAAGASGGGGYSATNEGMTPALRALVNERMSWECVMRCKTPFVLRLVDAIESVRHVHLVSECAAFGSLARILSVCRRPAQRLAEPAVRALFAELVLAVFDLHSSAGLVHNDLAVHAVHVTHTGHARLAEFSSATPSLLGANLSPDLYHYHYHHEQLFNPGPPLGASSPSLQRMGPLFRFQQQHQQYRDQPYDPLFGGSNAHHRHPHFDEPDDPDSPFCHHPARDMWGLGTILYCLLFGPVAVFSKFSSPTIPTHAQALVQCDLSTRAGRRRARGCVIVNVVHQQRQQRQRQRQLDKQQQQQEQQKQNRSSSSSRRRRIRRRNADASTTTATSTTTSVLMGDDDLVSNSTAASTMMMMHAATSAAGYNDSNSDAKIMEDEGGYDGDFDNDLPLVSDAAIDLVHALLHHDDSSRIDMYGVMGHPWLANTDWHAVRARAVDDVSVPVVVDALQAAHVTPVYPDQSSMTTTNGTKAGGDLDKSNNNGDVPTTHEQEQEQDGAAAAQQQQVYDDDASFRNLLNKHLACASLARPLCPSCLPAGQAQSVNKAYSTTSSNGRRPSGFSSSSSSAAYHHHHHYNNNNNNNHTNNNSDTDERDSMSSSISRASTYNKLAASALQRIARGFGAGRSNPIPMNGSTSHDQEQQDKRQGCMPDVVGATTAGCTGGGIGGGIGGGHGGHGGHGGGSGVVGAGVTATGTPVGAVAGGKTGGTDIRSDKALVGFDYVV